MAEDPLEEENTAGSPGKQMPYLNRHASCERFRLSRSAEVIHGWQC
jgi:hypothetical protein